ncbi:MAG TPA: MopE-related protein [Flavobacterium sp.]|nr:MopE-related protein [Flavobacterium sp.]
MKKITLLLICLFSGIAFAQPGSVDLTFNPGDTGFGSGTAASDYLLATAIQPDGKILIAGGFTSYDGTPRGGIARLNADGSLDTGFDPGTGITGGGVYVYAIAIQSDGKIVIGGSFTAVDGTPRNNIARLNDDGSLDTGYNVGTGTDNDISNISVQSDDKMILTGPFLNYNGTSQNTICRVNTDGSLDTGFNIGTAAGTIASRLIWTSDIQPDGKIVIGGGFLDFNGTPITRIARLNADGTLDGSFSAPAPNNTVLKIVVQPDGKVLAAGFFTNYNLLGYNCVTRLNANGTVDSGFIPGTGSDFGIQAMDIQSDGKIYIGGFFTSYNGSARSRIARLNTDGSLDTTFAVGTGCTGGTLDVYGLSVQSDDKVVIGGDFLAYNGTGRNRVARLNAYDAQAIAIASLSAAAPYCQNQALTLNYTAAGFYAGGNVFTAQLSDSSGSFASPVSIGTLTATTSGTINITIPGNTPAGSGYRIRVVSSTPVFAGTDNGTNLTVNALITYYQDADTDTYGNVAVPQVSCSPVPGYVTNSTDCDDTKASVHPGATEVGYNLIDDDCDGFIDEGFPPKVSSLLLCNYTLDTVDTYVYTSNVPGATGYRFRITTMSGPNTGQVQFFDAPLRAMRLTQLGSYAFSTTYKAEVAVYYAGYLQPYTTTNCTVSTPSASTQLTNCGATLTSLTNVIYANNVAYATGYKFKVYDPTGPSSQELVRSLREFRMNLITGFTVSSNKTYNVQVAVKNTDGSYLPYGPICTVTTPPSAREDIDMTVKNAFSAVAYPNPFSENVNIDLTTASQDKVTLKVYDMTGRLLDAMVVEVSEMKTLQVGDNYPTGVYNVIVSQGEEVKLLRIVKR